jgi:hypothetical protein
MRTWGSLQGVKAKSEANAGFSGRAMYVVDSLGVNGDFSGEQLGLLV